MLKLLIYLVIAAVCGSLGAAIAGARTRGCLTSIALGFIGAMIGHWLSRQLDIPDFLVLGRIPVFWSIIGAALFVTVINVLSGSKKR